MFSRLSADAAAGRSLTSETRGPAAISFFNLCEKVLAEKLENFQVWATGLRKFRDETFSDRLYQPVELRLKNGDLIRGFVGLYYDSYIISIELEDGGLKKVYLADVDRRSVRFFENHRLPFKPHDRSVLLGLMTLFEVSDQLGFEFTNSTGRKQSLEGAFIGFKTGINGVYRVGIRDNGPTTWVPLHSITLGSIRATGSAHRLHERSTSDLAQRLGVTSLVKVADVKDMVSTFQSGAFLPGEHQRWHDGVYMEARGQAHTGRPHTPYNDPHANRDVIVYVMDTLPLDRTDYHATMGWHLGNQVTSRGDPVIQAGDQNGIEEFLTELPGVNEIVFKNPILMRHLKMLLVQPGQKQRVLKILNDARIDPPIKKSWDDIISEQGTWP